ncbi:class-II fumarase/aspartase family protein [Parashewanella tropica]|uniref:class-II fumarase/aspartase family protein n=1 Tax=Parashewanella tropica TaxID=2547970 RepID=UPI00105AA648|nr:adenylosuccinate lyase family protein [Parashewanella tropica]
MKKTILSLCLTASLFAGNSTTTHAETMAEPYAPNVSVFDSVIYRDLFGTKEMRQVFSDENLIKNWLLYERTLANAQAKYGVIPKKNAEAIAEAAQWKNIDLDFLRKGTNKTGRSISTLTKIIRKAGGKEVSNYLHWGSTTQDVMDTATVLQVKQALELIDKQLEDVIALTADLAEKHKRTLMVARTNGQQATPTTFGFRIATYMVELHNHRKRIADLMPRVTIGQSTGAVGTLAATGPKGLKVQAEVMKQLGLNTPLMAWNASRDHLAEAVAVTGLIHGTLGRLATDINNWSRLEVGEVKEGEGGASSTMPQKKNPRASEFMGGLAQMARLRMSGVLEITAHADTRTGSPWIVEWSLIPEMFLITSASLNRAERMFAKLEVFPERMRRNLDLSEGYSMSESVMQYLAVKIGRNKAYKAVKTAIKKAKPGQTLREIILANPELKKEIGKDLDKVLDPNNYLGAAPEMVERAVKAVRKGV